MAQSASRPSPGRVLLVLVVLWPTAVIGLVLGLPLILVTGPLGVLLVYVSVISGVRLIEAANTPSEAILRCLVCPWFVGCVAAAVFSAAWGAIRITRGDPGGNELFVAVGFAAAAAGYLALMQFRPPGWSEVRDAFRRPKGWNGRV